MAVKTPKMPEGLKDIKLSSALIHEVVVALQANARQNTASTKDRSEKRGGGRKPWRQKGTGRARHGSSRSPLWRGGGVTFGPRPDRNAGKNMPSRKKRQAANQIIAGRIAEGSLMVSSSINLDQPKTRYAESFIKESLGGDFSGRVLLIVKERSEELYRAFRNIPYVTMREGLNFNVYDLLYNDVIIFTSEAWDDYIQKRGIK